MKLRFLSPESGVKLPLEEFPSLFAMLSHTGYFGVFFSALWFATVSIYVPQTVTRFWILAVLICFAFFCLSWLSVTAGVYLSDKIYDLQKWDTEYQLVLEIRVRIWITTLTASFVIICSFLIWFTGGVDSPFVPFYVTLFAVTISKVRIPYPGSIVTYYFVVAILTACLAREFWIAPLSQAELETVRDSFLQTLIRLLFICAALIAPLLSFYFANRRTARALIEQIRSSYPPR